MENWHTKFQAWHKKKKKWIKVEFQVSCEGQTITVWGAKNGNDYTSNREKKIFKPEDIVGRENKYSLFIGLDIELVQFTGLLDKNGKEIYKGDILRHPAKDNWEKTNYVAYEVFFHDNDCADNHIGFQMNRIHCFGSVCGTRGMQPKMLPKYTKQMEIIGNKFKNPELMPNQ